MNFSPVSNWANRLRVFVVGALLHMCVHVPLSHAEVSPGQSAPVGVAFQTWDGATKSLSDFQGKIIVLEWYNPDCPFVRKHYIGNNMQSLQKEYTGKGVVWLSVNSSAAGKQGHLSAAEARARMETAGGHPTSVVLDHEGTLGKAFGAKTTPHMFIVDGAGKVVYAGAIDDNDSARVETIAGAKNYVRAALDELLAGKPVTVAETEAYGCSVKYAS